LLIVKTEIHVSIPETALLGYIIKSAQYRNQAIKRAIFRPSGADFTLKGMLYEFPETGCVFRSPIFCSPGPFYRLQICLGGPEQYHRIPWTAHAAKHGGPEIFQAAAAQDYRGVAG
jgi:hypothetical protein